MIPEEAKPEIIKKRAAGQTWAGIANWLKDAFGVEVHRTTIQRCHDKELFAHEGISTTEDDDPADRVKTRITLDKKVATFK